MTQETEFIFDPSSEEFAADPYPVYEQIRLQGAFVPHEDMGTLLLARYDTINQAATHPKLVRSLEAFLPAEEIVKQRRVSNWHDMPNHQRYVQTSLLESDGQTHRRLRQLVFGTFTAKHVARYRAGIERYVDALLDNMLAHGKADIVADLATPVPGHIIGHIIGVPESHRDQLRIWSENVVQFYDVSRTADDKLLAERATTEFVTYLKELITYKKQQPADDIISALNVDCARGDLSETELISTCMLLLMAGHGSTIDVIGTGLYNLLRHPDQMQRLRNDRSLMTTAVQEMFRFDTPLPFFQRHAAKDVEICGQKFSKGTNFGFLYAAANRDPTQFDSPDTFDIGRKPNRHLSFGRGAHLCLGNHLSRLDMEVIFSRLLERTQSITLDGQAPRFRTGLSTRGLDALNVQLNPA